MSEVTVTRTATTGALEEPGTMVIQYFSDGRAYLWETGGGRDEPLLVPKPEWHEYNLDKEYLDQWTRATQNDTTRIEPFTPEDEAFWSDNNDDYAGNEYESQGD